MKEASPKEHTGWPQDGEQQPRGRRADHRCGDPQGPRVRARRFTASCRRRPGAGPPQGAPGATARQPERPSGEGDPGDPDGHAGPHVHSTFRPGPGSASPGPGAWPRTWRRCSAGLSARAASRFALRTSAGHPWEASTKRRIPSREPWPRSLAAVRPPQVAAAPATRRAVPATFALQRFGLQPREPRHYSPAYRAPPCETLPLPSAAATGRRRPRAHRGSPPRPPVRSPQPGAEVQVAREGLRLARGARIPGKCVRGLIRRNSHLSGPSPTGAKCMVFAPAPRTSLSTADPCREDGSWRAPARPGGQVPTEGGRRRGGPGRRRARRRGMAPSFQHRLGPPDTPVGAGWGSCSGVAPLTRSGQALGADPHSLTALIAGPINSAYSGGRAKRERGAEGGERGGGMGWERREELRVEELRGGGDGKRERGVRATEPALPGPLAAPANRECETRSPSCLNSADGAAVSGSGHFPDERRRQHPRQLPSTQAAL